MGMYTQLKLDVYLNKDLPQEVESALHMMCSIEDRREKIHELGIQHPLFETWRAVWMFRGASAYFDDCHEPIFRRKPNKGNRYELSLWFNIKNYEKEIEKFLDWISPYVDMKPGIVGQLIRNLVIERNEWGKIVHLPKWSVKQEDGTIKSWGEHDV